jgi:hypothetical protein
MNLWPVKILWHVIHRRRIRVWRRTRSAVVWDEDNARRGLGKRRLRSRGRGLTRNVPQYAFHRWRLRKVAGRFTGRCSLRLLVRSHSAAIAFFRLFTFAQRFRCASAIACRALALSLRRGLGSEPAGADAFFDDLRVVSLPVLPRRARAWRNRAISSSRAFNMWSFKDVPFSMVGGPRHAKEYQVGRAWGFTWELWQTVSR